MLIDFLSTALERSHVLDGFWGKLDAGEDATLGVASSARAFLVAARFVHEPRTTLVVVPGEDPTELFARNLSSFLGEDRVLRLNQPSHNPFNVEAKRDIAEVAQRMEALWALQSGRECVVVVQASALLRKVVPAQAMLARPLELSQGIDLADGVVPGVEDFDDLCRMLVDLGYENTGSLMGPGSFATHGGVIDVWPGNLKAPVRLDFFGDELDEIRRFLPSTGQTISSLPSVTIYPVREFLVTPKTKAAARKALLAPSESNPALRELLAILEDGSHEVPDALLPYLHGNLTTAVDYLAKGALTVLLEPRALFDDALHAHDELERKAAGSSVAVDSLFVQARELDFGRGQRATYVSIMRAGVAPDAELVVKRVDAGGSVEKLFGRLRTFADNGFTVVFSVPNLRAREDMKLALSDQGIPFDEVLDMDLAFREGEGGGEDAPRRLRRGRISIVDVDIPLGMNFPAAKIALATLADAAGSMRTQTARRVDVTEITFPYKPGDYVVHAAHGVAFFRDLVRRDVEGVERDYLLLEYADGDKLFVPVEQFDRVTRYVGPEGSSPRLTRLNTSDWNRAVNRARKATKQLAFDLVDVYTRRAASKGFAYSPDTEAQKRMEEDFPYQETDDQLAAIRDVKADMQASRPMDRLICGDVGFGKTEVALRAAFKATQDHKQVMVLCPTTILAQQHYASFKKRFEPYGVRVEVLSRFRTPAQQKAALEGFANGDVAVLVGTHRLLSRDVNPRDLGLVIIDEEQRFGVGHKEQLKNMRESIDVLTLSATPIPRTMQMGLSGVRDMSLILTPPGNRLPVKVHVGEWDPDIVADAIGRELDRHGQVYYVSNRVRSIEDAVKRVSAAAGEARIGVAHGQMSKDQLERVMEDFNAGEIDVLVATTIIESGLDNPHSNTLIIEDSQRLGLAQMYQLKGRVGRSSVQAYAYFLFPDSIPLTEEAMARLTAINDHTELGAGIQISLRDLEIRGAGDLLGAEQSGNMSAVGFDLFAQMLAQAVNLTREGVSVGEDYLPPALSDIVVNTPDSTFIPEEYIPDADARVLFYRKIASADTVEVVDAIQEEMLAKHPEMPEPTLNQFAKARLKAFANAQGIQTVSVVGGKLVVEPISLTKEQQTQIRRKHGHYNVDKRKLSVPMGVVGQTEGTSTLVAISAYLEKLVARRKEAEERLRDRANAARAARAASGAQGQAAAGRGAGSGVASGKRAFGSGAAAGAASGAAPASETGGSTTGHKGKGAERFGKRADRTAKAGRATGSSAARQSMVKPSTTQQSASQSSGTQPESEAAREARQLGVSRVVPRTRRGIGKNGKPVNRRNW